MTKEFVRLMVLNMMWQIASSRDLYLKLSKALNFMLRVASIEETAAFWSERKGRTAGSDQRLMTKVRWCSLSDASERGMDVQLLVFSHVVYEIHRIVLRYAYINLWLNLRFPTSRE